MKVVLSPVYIVNKNQLNSLKKIKNVLLLPLNKSPEQFLSKYLYDLKDEHFLWKEIDETFNHQYCFKEYSNEEIQTDRFKAKKWFNNHLHLWGRNASKVLNVWKKDNIELVNEFNANFDKLILKIKSK